MTTPPLVMVFLGAPGAGKGTYCKEITAHYGCPQVSTGDMFRMAVKEGHPVGLMAKSYMDQGTLVPDAVVLDVVRERIEREDCRRNGIILDGFPRTLSQADALPALLKGIGLSLDLVVNLIVEREVLIKRLTGRRMCRSCTKGNFNVYTLPPKKEGVCDFCGGELYQREDDKLAVIENRLKVYETQTHPLIEYYRSRGSLHDLPVGGDIKGMVATILGLIDRALKARQAS
ncbi:MAG TPA: adenylate kinase [bacterium]|jgi:adenylate kinase|nr:adenylate kinase [bacterium]